MLCPLSQLINLRIDLIKPDIIMALNIIVEITGIPLPEVESQFK